MAKKGKELSENLLENVSGGVVEDAGGGKYLYEDSYGSLQETDNITDAIINDKDSTSGSDPYVGWTRYTAHGGKYDGKTARKRLY